MEIKLNESQIDDLVKLALSEERKKVISENWTRNGDSNGYWKILYDTLKKGGIPVNLQYANDPAKSTFMWWGTWVIWKDLTKNGGYPISFTTPARNNLFFKFRENGNKYVGQSSLDRILLDSECINYYYRMNNNLFKSDQKTTFKKLANDMSNQGKTIPFKCIALNFSIKTEKLIEDGKETRKERLNAWDTSIGPFLEKNKPSNATFDNNEAIKSYTYSTGRKLMFYKSGGVYYPDKGIKGNYPTRYADWEWDNKKGILLITNTKGQKLDIGQVIYDPYTQFIAGDVEDEKLANQIFNDLKKAFDYDNDGVWNDYDRTDETLAMNAINKIKNKGVLEKLNAKIAAGGFSEIKNVEEWFKLEMSDWDPDEWDAIAVKLNSLGYSVPKATTIAKIYGYTVGGAINMVDKGITAVEDKFNYANKQTAVRKYTQPQALQILETQVSPAVDFLADVIMNASRWFGDNEIVVEKAFSRINDKTRYNQLKLIMKEDPYLFVKKFMKTEKPYGKYQQSVDASYQNIFTPKMSGLDINSKDFMKNLNSKLTFRVDNPSGTGPKFINKNTNTVVFELIKGANIQDPYIKGDTAQIIKNFGWDLNPKLYPYPLAYPMDWINAAKKDIGQLNSEAKYLKLLPKQKIIEDIVKKYRKKIVNEVDDSGVATQQDVIDYEESRNKRASTEYQNQKFEPIKIMQDWNSELARQKQLIPKYCTTPLEVNETLEYEKPTVVQGGETVYNKKTKVISSKKISMSYLCKDYGGLWVNGGLTNKFTCACRDLKSPVFQKIQIDSGTNGKEAPIDATEIFGTFISIGTDIQDQQTSRDWTDVTTWVEVTKQAVEYATIVASLFFPATAPLIGLFGGLASFGLNASQGNTADAAIALLFSVLPGLKVLNIEDAIYKTLANKLIKGGVLTAKEVRAFYTIVNSEDAIATAFLAGHGNVKTLTKLAETKIVQGMSAAAKAEIYAARASIQGAKYVSKVGSDNLDPIKAQDLAKNIVAKTVESGSQEIQYSNKGV